MSLIGLSPANLTFEVASPGTIPNSMEVTINYTGGEIPVSLAINPISSVLLRQYPFTPGVFPLS